MKNYILMSAGAFEWRTNGIYYTDQQILDELGFIDIHGDIHDIDEYLDDNEMEIEKGDYFPKETNG